MTGDDKSDRETLPLLGLDARSANPAQRLSSKPFGRIYTPTTAEIFWALTEDTRIRAYELYRNGVLVMTRNANSHLDGNLEPASDYIYEIIVLERSDRRRLLGRVVLTTPPR